MMLFLLIFLNLTAKADCLPATSKDPISYLSPFDKSERTGFSPQQMERYFNDVYTNGARRKDRIYFDQSLKEFVAPIQKNLVVVPKSFIEKIESHINLAVKNGYAEYIFFPDMGHAHIFLPPALATKLNQPSADISAGYKEIFNSNFKLLYHTAEYLNTNPYTRNEHIDFRYLNRNIIGNMSDGSIEIAVQSTKQVPTNTVRSIPDLTQWDRALIYMQANHNGCFSYKKDHKTFYFDAGF